MANRDEPKGMIPWADCPPPTYVDVAADCASFQIYDALTWSSDGYFDPAAAGNSIDAIALEAHTTGTAASILAVKTKPGAQFKMQTVTGTDFTQTMCNNNCDLVKGAGAGLYSDDEADISGVNTTTAQLRIIKLAPLTGNALGEHADIIVEVNENYMTKYTEATDGSRLGPSGT